MATKEEKKIRRSLLITAEAKDGCVFGHGLPYPLPIVNPVWVGIEYIAEAYTQGLVEMIVYNTETPMLLDDALYNQFIEMGYIDDDIIEEHHIAPVMGQPVLSKEAANTGERITLEAPLEIGENTSNALVKLELIGYNPNLEVTKPLTVKTDKITAEFKCVKAGEVSFTLQQVMMGENRDEAGTKYTFSVDITASPEAPIIDDFIFDNTKVKVDDKIIVTGNLSGSKLNPELLKVKVEGTDTILKLTKEFKANEDVTEVSGEFTAVKAGNTTLKLTQVETGIYKNTPGISVEKLIEVEEKDQAPNMGKPVLSTSECVIGDKVKVSAVLSGKMDHPELLVVEVDGMADLVQNSVPMAKVEGQNKAEGEFTALKAGLAKITMQQKQMGPNKDVDGTKYTLPLTINEPAPDVDLVSLTATPNPVIGGGEVTITATFNLEPELETANFTVDEALVEKIPFAVKGKTIVGTFTTSVVDAPVTKKVTLVYEEDTKELTITINPVPKAVLKTLVASPTTITGGQDVTFTGTFDKAPVLSEVNITPEAGLKVKTAAKITGNTVVVVYTADDPVTSKAIKVTMTHNGVTKEESVTVNPIPVALQTAAATPNSVVGGNEVTIKATFNKAPTLSEVTFTPDAGVTIKTQPALSGTTVTAVYTVADVPTNTSKKVSVKHGSVTKDATFAVTPKPVTLTGLTSAPTSVVGGSDVVVTATFDKTPVLGSMTFTPEEGLTQKVVPAVSGNTIKVTYTAADVPSNDTKTVTGKYGSVTKTVDITVTPKPATLSAATAEPASVVGGSTVVITAKFDKAPTLENAVFTPDSGLTQKVAPALSGNNITATYTAADVTNNTDKKVTVKYSSVTKEAALTVTPKPAVLQSAVCTPTEITGTGEVTLTATFDKAPTLSGANITPDEGITVKTEPSVSGNTITGVYTVAAVEADTPKKIRVVYGGVTKDASVTVKKAAAEA